MNKNFMQKTHTTKKIFTIYPNIKAKSNMPRSLITRSSTTKRDIFKHIYSHVERSIERKNYNLKRLMKKARSPYVLRNMLRAFKVKSRHAFPTERHHHVKHIVNTMNPKHRRTAYYKLFKLFFFWFILLYKDLYYYLIKTAWNLWFNFLNISFIRIHYSKFFNNINWFYLSMRGSNVFNFYKLHVNYNSINFINPVALHTVNGNMAFLLKGASTKKIKYFNFSQPLAFNFIAKLVSKHKQNHKYKKAAAYKRLAYKT